MRSTIYPLLLYICKNIKLFGTKQIRLFGSFIIALLALSCGSDDDSIENSLANGKHITVVERIYNNKSYSNYFTYDPEGRVISLRTVSSTSSDYNTIAYSPEMIKISSFANNYCEYNILNGRIVSAHDGYNRDYSYTYDNNNNLISSTEQGQYTYSFTWNNGNITKIILSHSGEEDEVNIECSNIRCPQNYIFSTEFGFPNFSGRLYGVQWLLMAEGYFGNKPRNLPKSIYGIECNRTLDADGYPASVQMLDNTFNITWN